MTKTMKKSILEHFTFENFDKVMDMISKGIQQFGESMDQVTRELSMDVEKSNSHSKNEDKKYKENLDKLWGNSEVKIWSDKKTKVSLF